MSPPETTPKRVVPCTDETPENIPLRAANITVDVDQDIGDVVVADHGSYFGVAGYQLLGKLCYYGRESASG